MSKRVDEDFRKTSIKSSHLKGALAPDPLPVARKRVRRSARLLQWAWTGGLPGERKLGCSSQMGVAQNERARVTKVVFGSIYRLVPFCYIYLSLFGRWADCSFYLLFFLLRASQVRSDGFVPKSRGCPPRRIHKKYTHDIYTPDPLDTQNAMTRRGNSFRGSMCPVLANDRQDEDASKLLRAVMGEMSGRGEFGGH